MTRKNIALAAIIAASLQGAEMHKGGGEAQASPFFLCKSIHRSFAVLETTLYGFAPIWFGDGTGFVLAGYEVDLDQCSGTIEGAM